MQVLPPRTRAAELPQAIDSALDTRFHLPRTAGRAVGAWAIGALALGAFAVGAVAIGRLSIGRARIRRLEIDELSVRILRVAQGSEPGAKPTE
jgi:hypothetical protein